jgi:predicted patatin/cPLA2 family phospholipase
MSESQNSSTHSKPTEKEALKLEKQKCKVLKAALKEEKKARDTVNKELASCLARVEQLQAQIQDKDKRYKDIFEEKIRLESVIMTEAKSTRDNEEEDFFSPKQKRGGTVVQ